MSKAALHDPAVAAEARTVRFATAGDDGCDPESSQQPTVLVVVIASVGEQPVGLLTWATNLPFDRPPVEVFDQRQ